MSRSARALEYRHPAAASRMAYFEILPVETRRSCQKILLQVSRFFRDHGVKVLRIMTGNGAGFRSPGSRKSVADAAYLKDPKKQPVETRQFGTCQR